MSNRQYVIVNGRILDSEEYLFEEFKKRPFKTIVDYEKEILYLIPVDIKKEISENELKTLFEDYKKQRIDYWKYEVKEFKQENKV